MKTIPLINLLYLVIPLVFVWFFYKKWVGNQTEIIYSTIRMVVQLLLIGYLLLYLFENKNLFLGGFIITFMIVVTSWISLRNLQVKSPYEYSLIFIAIGISGILHLIIVLYFILELEYIYEPQYVIPIAGMVFANIMNGLSIAIERYETEYKMNKDFIDSRKHAFKAAMIPQINSLLAVGLVSLPGMMTGQILSGVDPLIAVRYQIMIMAIILSSAGMSIITYFIIKEKTTY